MCGSKERSPRSSSHRRAHAPPGHFRTEYLTTVLLVPLIRLHKRHHAVSRTRRASQPQPRAHKHLVVCNSAPRSVRHRIPGEHRYEACVAILARVCIEPEPACGDDDRHQPGRLRARERTSGMLTALHHARRTCPDTHSPIHAPSMRARCGLPPSAWLGASPLPPGHKLSCKKTHHLRSCRGSLRPGCPGPVPAAPPEAPQERTQACAPRQVSRGMI